MIFKTLSAKTVTYSFIHLSLNIFTNTVSFVFRSSPIFLFNTPSAAIIMDVLRNATAATICP